MDTFNRDAHYSRGDHDIDMIVKRRDCEIAPSSGEGSAAKAYLVT